MQKVNFDNAGLQHLLQSLYALPDHELQQEAMLVQADFTKWLQNHFNFNQQQLDYLLAMDEVFLDESGTHCAYFIANRLPISLFGAQSLTAIQRNNGEDRGKLFRRKQISSATYSAELGSSNQQLLSFSIEYLKTDNS